MQGVQIQSLFGVQGSHVPCGQKTKTQNRSHTVTHSIKTLNLIHSKYISKKKRKRKKENLVETPPTPSHPGSEDTGWEGKAKGGRGRPSREKPCVSSQIYLWGRVHLQVRCVLMTLNWLEMASVPCSPNGLKSNYCYLGEQKACNHPVKTVTYACPVSGDECLQNYWLWRGYLRTL